MEVIEDIACSIAYYAVKAVYYACIVFIIWLVLSWAEIAFTVKSPDTIPTYSGWNFSGYHLRAHIWLAVFKGSQSPTVRMSDAVTEEFPQVWLQSLFLACVKSE